jgi:hypothetical protein
MIHIRRTVLTLTAIVVLLPISTRVAPCQSKGSAEAAEETYTISGSVGVPEVVMQGLPGEPLTDQSGVYSAEVPEGWSGRVTPMKEGFSFEPPSRIYTRVSDDCEHDYYRAKRLRFTISGNVGVGDVLMRGLPGGVVSDSRGSYRVEVDYGWSGTVAPAKEELTFEPTSRVYRKVAGHLSNQDFKAKELMVTISDSIVIGDEPIQDVQIRAEPGGYSAVTDNNGRYSIKVPYGWSGKLIMEKPGFLARPVTFTNVTSDIVGGEPSQQWTPPGVPSQSGRRRASSPPTAPGPLEEVLIIPSTELVPEVAAETAEDMQVMLRILRDKLSEPRMIMGVWNDYGDFFSGGGREAFYLQGYGALFVLEVDFPLSFAAPPTDPTEAQEQTVDPVWQRARQRLYAPPGSRRSGDPLARSTETDRASFEQFEEDLLRTLKHAANIRHLDPNEKVILTIIGQGQGALPGSGFSGGGSFSGGGWGFEGGSWTYSGGSFGYGGGRTYGDSGAYSRGSGRSAYGRRRGPLGPPAASTVLTFQATKADVDAFAAGTLDFERFRQRVRTFTY